MIFSYEYVPHSMEKMQQFVDYIFYKVWCRANTKKPYNLDLFNKKYELKKIIVSFHYSSTKGGDLFNQTIEDVYAIFQTFSKKQKVQIKQWYKSNNDIKHLCEKDMDITPVTYNELKDFHEELSKKFKKFFPKLYGKDIIGLKAVREAIGVIDDHYYDFIKINNNGICPFCGINDIDGNFVHTREAYDHYLPKEKYPFNSINFKNLAPMCNKCNSSNKLRQNPIINPRTGLRRKAFYPYCNQDLKIDISLEIKINDIKKIKEKDLIINLASIDFSEEVETWQEVFYIEERYKQKCASPAHGKYWYTQIMNEIEGLSPQDVLRKKMNQMNASPFADNNFLRKPFLQACEDKGLFGYKVESKMNICKRIYIYLKKKIDGRYKKLDKIVRR